MAIINVRRMRDAFVRTGDGRGERPRTGGVIGRRAERAFTKERLETLEERIDARFTVSEAKTTVGFAQAEADAERRANRHTTIFLAALALAVAVIALLTVVV